MKKISIYIFMLIVVTGIFIPVLDVQAVDPKGTCTISAVAYVGPTIPPKVYNDVLKSWCDEAIRKLNEEQPNKWTMTFEPKPDANIICPDPQILINGTCSTPPAGGGTEGDYVLLQPLPCKDGNAGCPKDGNLTKFNTKDENALCNYLNLIINLVIGLCAVIAVVMIVIGGMEYATSELSSKKEEGKERIWNAILGLLLALFAWLLLFTINPDLLNVCMANDVPPTIKQDSVAMVSYKIEDAGQIQDIKTFYLSQALTGLESTYCPMITSAMFKMLVPKKAFAQLFDEVPCALLNKNACEYATSGVEGIKNPDGSPMKASSILGIFGQETSQGAAFKNSTWCVKSTAGMYGADPKRQHPTDPAKTFPGDATLLNEVINKLPPKYTSEGVRVTAENIGLSCKGSGLAGGAMGYTQFLPQTWLAMMEYGKNKGYIPLNKDMLDPWNPRDALRMAAIYISYLGGDKTNADLNRSACQFFGGETPGKPCTGTGGHACSMLGGQDTYGNCVIKTLPSMRKFCPDGTGGPGDGSGDGGGQGGGDYVSASNITCNSATVTANIETSDNTRDFQVWFEYGPDYNINKEVEHKPKKGGGRFSFTLTGLTENTVYGVRAKSSSIAGILTSPESSYFITSSCEQ